MYKYNPIRTDEVRGSCEHFDTREEIPLQTIAELSVAAVEERYKLVFFSSQFRILLNFPSNLSISLFLLSNSYGARFVIVASQNIRNNLLIPRSFPTDAEISISMYCILERLGRARYNGELNQGKYSLSDIAGDPIMAYSYK